MNLVMPEPVVGYIHTHYSITDGILYAHATVDRIRVVYSDTQATATSVDTDQTPQNAASDYELHCLPLIQQFKLLISSQLNSFHL